MRTSSTTRAGTLLALAASLAAGLGVLLTATGEGRAQGPSAQRATAPAAKPGEDIAVLHAQAFHLAEPYEHAWSAERPRVQSGWLLVLEVPPQLARQRALATPVLYVGDQIPERVNQGWPGGRLVAIVPGAVDLAAAPIWFGSAGLPETIDAQTVAAERARALSAAVAPRPQGELDEALTRGGQPLVLADYDALREQAAALVLMHAPEEHELAEGILAPPPEQARVRSTRR